MISLKTAERELNRGLIKASDAYIKEGRKQLLIQGHRASGALEKSFEAEINSFLDGVPGASISFNEYGLSLDTGVPANNVRYPVNALIPWARIVMPGKSIQEVLNFLWATRSKHKEEGIGTKAATRFSSNGKRTGWIGDTVEEVKNVEDYINFDKVIQFVLDEIGLRYGS